MCPGCPSKLFYNHPSSSKRAAALAMPDMVMPMCRAISARDNPNPSPAAFRYPCRNRTHLAPAAVFFEDIRIYSSFFALFPGGLLIILLPGTQRPPYLFVQNVFCGITYLDPGRTNLDYTPPITFLPCVEQSLTAATVRISIELRKSKAPYLKRNKKEEVTL